VAATGATFLAAVIPAVAIARGEKMTSQNVVDTLVLRNGRGCGKGQGGKQDDEGSGEVHGGCQKDGIGLASGSRSVE